MTAASHYELSLEQADGLFELERSRNERGDTSDLFAGVGARFADDTVPSSKWWDGTATHLAIGSISEIGPTMSFRCTFANVIDTPGGGIIRRESAPGLNIPDNQATGISDTIQIPEAVTIADIKVTVDISHTYRGDLQVTLVPPWGAAIVLHPKNKGGGDNDLKVTYDAGNMPALAAWRGRTIQGAWRLEVKDLAPADVGRLNRWVLEFTPAAVTAGPVVLQESPGAIVPDNQSAGIERVLTTAGGGAVGEIEVAVDISHTYIGDLRLSLVSPTGVEVVLHNRTGDNADNIVKTYTRATTPEFAMLGGTAIAGNWKLRVSDREAVDVGKLNSWKLTIRPA